MTGTGATPAAQPMAAALAVDIGASSGRVMLATLEPAGPYASGADGPALRLEEAFRFANGAGMAGDELVWDFERLWRDVLAGLAAGLALARGRGVRVATVGIDTWGVDFGLIDADGRLTGPVVSHRDARTDGVMERLHAGPLSKATIYAETGIQFLPFNTIYQAEALARTHPGRLDGATALLTVPDLLHHRLTGRVACEATNASTTQLLRVGGATGAAPAWSAVLAGAVGLPARLLPEVVLPGTSLGPLLPDVAAALGDGAADVRVVAVGTHDTASAVAGVPAGKRDSGWAYLSCGTWSLLGAERTEPVATPRAMALNFTNERGVAGTYRLLKNIMGLWLLQECARTWDEAGTGADWDTLLAEAEDDAATPPFRSLINPDHRSFLAPGDMPARIRALCAETGEPVPETRGQITRCVMESLALRYARTLAELEELTGTPATRLHLVGGGCRNRPLCRWTAEACGVTVEAGPVEATALGNAATQFVATGALADVASGRAAIARAGGIETFRPTSGEGRRGAGWDGALERFAALTTA